MRNTIYASISGAILLGLMACTGGGGKKDATSLNYTNPASASGYRFVRAAGNTGGKLILELRGPAAESGRGVNFTFQTDAAKAPFAKVNASDAELARNGGVFDLGAVAPLFKSVAEGGTMRVSLAQKGKGNARLFEDKALALVAIELKSGQAKGPIQISASNASILPASGDPAAITIAVGSLEAE